MNSLNELLSDILTYKCGCNKSKGYYLQSTKSPQYSNGYVEHFLLKCCDCNNIIKHVVSSPSITESNNKLLSDDTNDDSDYTNGDSGTDYDSKTNSDSNDSTLTDDNAPQKKYGLANIILKL